LKERFEQLVGEYGELSAQYDKCLPTPDSNKIDLVNESAFEALQKGMTFYSEE